MRIQDLSICLSHRERSLEINNILANSELVTQYISHKELSSVSSYIVASPIDGRLRAVSSTEVTDTLVSSVCV